MIEGKKWRFVGIKPEIRDLWFGIYWNEDVDSGVKVQKDGQIRTYNGSDAVHVLTIYICLVPMVPLVFERVVWRTV